jgi:predicted secreted protein
MLGYVKPMKSRKSLLLAFLIASSLSFSSQAELQDQGLNSIMEIIDKAIEEINQPVADGAEVDSASIENAISAIVNLSRTLGTLSYSRLQCGEAEVLAEFTQRVQQLPEDNRDAMRDAFQEGFDKSKAETTLLSEDECKRLTQSRERHIKSVEANVTEDASETKAVETEEVVEVVELPAEDPKFRHLRIAELSGQLAYRRKLCQDEKVFTRDYNEFLETIPEDYREQAKNAYWKGYKHGKRLNKYFTQDQCPHFSPG